MLQRQALTKPRNRKSQGQSRGGQMLMVGSANRQASTVVENISHLLAGEPLEEYHANEPRGIHLSLGLVSWSMELQELED